MKYIHRNRVTWAQAYAIKMINDVLGYNYKPADKWKAYGIIATHYKEAKRIKAMNSIVCPHASTCTSAGMFPKYCCQEYEDDSACANYKPHKKGVSYAKEN